MRLLFSQLEDKTINSAKADMGVVKREISPLLSIKGLEPNILYKETVCSSVLGPLAEKPPSPRHKSKHH